MFMQHGHAAWTYSMELQRKDMDIKDWNAVLTWSIETWTSSMDMQLKVQHGHAAKNAAWIHSKEMQHGENQHGHAAGYEAWRHGHGPSICIIGMYHWYVEPACKLNMHD